ncbi:hypothetical protein [Actinomadura sp. NEAU-AAG7]|uniref:hypothetical protein n=1 Tax=Actinomadura sp. NEAU-AAG7 TaxID=2839640 RepID=UPI001BE43C07|nr:hypothetical protein [Actinomadura sp. NEAU-AAG7]MBT2208258.1 hypothetical protein [Actinomadura sp. NEAU-AAG7]
MKPHDEIPAPPATGLGTIQVTEVGGGGVTFVSDSENGSITFSGQAPGMTSRMNGLKITTVAIEGHRAVVRLRR